MAVLTVTEDHKQRTAGLDTSRASARRFFQVTFDSSDAPENRPLLARFASAGGTSVPALYSAHPYNSQMYVSNVGVESIGPLDYMVEVDYITPEANPDEENPQDPNFNPLEQPWEIEWDFAETTEPIDSDINGSAIENSSEEQFDPPIQREFSDLVLRITRNEASFNYALALTYKDAINSDSFYGFAPGLAKVKTIRATRQKSGTAFYWQVTYEIHVRYAYYNGVNYGWKKRILDQGFRKLANVFPPIDPDTFEYIYYPIKDEEGNLITRPRKLDGFGNLLRSDRIDVFLEIDIYESKPFSVLALE